MTKTINSVRRNLALTYGPMDLLQRAIKELGAECPKATECLQHAHGLMQRALSALDTALLSPSVITKTPEPLSKPALVPATKASGEDVLDALNGVCSTPVVMPSDYIPPVPPQLMAKLMEGTACPVTVDQMSKPTLDSVKSNDKPPTNHHTAAKQLCRLDVPTFAAMLMAHGVNPQLPKFDAALALAAKGVKAADAKKPAPASVPAPSVEDKTPAPKPASTPAPKGMEVNVDAMPHDTLKGIAVCLKPSVLREIVSNLPEAQLRDIIAKLSEKEVVAACKLHVKNSAA